MSNPAPAAGAGHFEWVDRIRGMAILWVVYFHCFIAYGTGYPWLINFANFGSFLQECAVRSPLGNFTCVPEGILAGLMERGAQGVGVFILFSGFGLTYSLFRKKSAGPQWSQWYRRRLLRLFPIYWLAHFLILASPIRYRPDPVDWRFLLSLLGDRVYPVKEMFYYFNPSWWFFGLLLELYIVFPLLYGLLRRLGSLPFLALCTAATVVSRYLLYAVFQVDGNWVQGAFFACRLWEFAAGMVLGKLLAEDPGKTLQYLFSPWTFFLGILTYALSVLSYGPTFFYSFSDGLNAMGLTMIMVHLALWSEKIPGLGKALAVVGVYSYSLYLFHQPFVMYAGEKLQSHHIGFYLGASTIIIAAITVLSILCESAMNRFLKKITG